MFNIFSSLILFAITKQLKVLFKANIMKVGGEQNELSAKAKDGTVSNE